MRESLRIGLFGYGNVGQGVYNILTSTKTVQNEIVKICCKHPEKKRNIPIDNFTFNKSEILDDPSVNLIVEVIDDSVAAFAIVKEALQKGKNVVTANKKMVADNMKELIQLQKETGKSILWEASACSSIPIIRTLEEYYDNDILHSVSGIFNSASNYILTKIFNENRDYDIALKQAQDLGYTETDATLDIVGFDAMYKLLIVTAHAFGLIIKPEDVVNHGIQNISRYDIQYAQEKGVRIKQMAVVRKVRENEIALFVLPQFIQKKERMYYVDLEYNAVNIDADYSGLQHMDGKGAGGFPTGSAVVSDISASTYNYQYEFKKYNREKVPEFTNKLTLEVYVRYYDKKNIELFEFDKISARFESKEYNYVVGHISLEKLHKIKSRINTADILIVSTGKYIER